MKHGSAATRLLGLWVRIPPESGYLSLVIVVCCQEESLRRADQSSTGVLPNVMCLSVMVKPQQ